MIIVGAGLSGLSCAFELSERGRSVVVLESRAVVGGRTSSWIEDGMPVESGLHRFLGFYSALPDLLHRAGISLNEMLVWEDEFEVRLPEPEPSGVFSVSPLHHPLSTVRRLLSNNDFLSAAEKLSLAKFMAAGLKDYGANPRELDQQSVLEYARKHEVSETIIHRMLVPLTAGVFFIPPERYSAFNLMGLLAPYIPTLLKMRLGAFSGGMTEVMAGPLAQAIIQRGGEVRTNAGVERLIVEGGRVAGVQLGTGELRAPHVVLATSILPAQRLVRDCFAGEPWCQPMLQLPSMPAVTLQMELDEPSMDIDRTTFAPGTVLASFSEQSRTTFKHAAGRLSVILTPPEEFLDMPAEQVLARVCADADRLGMRVTGHVRAYRVTRHPADFHSLAPGYEHLRPTQATRVPGLALAGDYTRQKYLATMEGAVVSGREAAEIVVNA